MRGGDCAALLAARSFGDEQGVMHRSAILDPILRLAADDTVRRLSIPS
jgi:hypothetical protein